MSRSVIIEAQTVSETVSGADYYAAWWQPSPGQTWETVTSVSWGATIITSADAALPFPPGPVRTRVTDNDVEGELCLVDRKLWSAALARYEKGSVFEEGRPSLLYATLMSSFPRITLGTWANGVDGPRIVSVFGADELGGFLSQSGACGTQSALVGVCRDLSPLPAPNNITLSLSIAVMEG